MKTEPSRTCREVKILTIMKGKLNHPMSKMKNYIKEARAKMTQTKYHNEIDRISVKAVSNNSG